MLIKSYITAGCCKQLLLCRLVGLSRSSHGLVGLSRSSSHGVVGLSWSLSTAVQRKEADDVKHASEMENSRAQLQQLEGLSVFPSFCPIFTDFAKSVFFGQPFIKWFALSFSPQFLAHVYCGQTAGWMDHDATWYGGRPGPR